jgi:hypothetical protein
MKFNDSAFLLITDLNQIQEQNPVIIIVIEKKYSSHHGNHKT